MQIVIEINDEIYETLKKCEVMASGLRSEKTFTSKIYTAVANGTPLPKGHGRLIDFDALDKDFDKCTCAGDCGFLICPVYNQKTIIEADRAESEDKE